jgi:hypothetical protein
VLLKFIISLWWRSSCVEKQSLQNGLNRSLSSSIAPVSNAELVKFYVRVDVEPNPPKLGPFINAMNSKFA